MSTKSPSDLTEAYGKRYVMACQMTARVKRTCSPAVKVGGQWIAEDQLEEATEAWNQRLLDQLDLETTDDFRGNAE